MLIGFVGVLLITACNKGDALVVDPDNPLVGTWVQAEAYGNEAGLVTYTRASKLKTDYFGLVFHADGKVVQRQIAGWCATPPWAFENYEGLWDVNDSILHTSLHYQWMEDTVEQTWEVISVNNSKLVLKYQ